MKKMHLVISLLAAGILAVIVCQGALADGGKPIAGVLTGPFDAFSFKSDGDQVLFAEIKSDYYQTRGRMGGSHETGEETEGGCSDGGSSGGMPSETPPEGTSGGCTDSTHTDDTHDDSCGGGGGPGDLCLQVLSEEGTMICWAGRPARPGWQRDPRLACPISEEGDYLLRVALGPCGPGGHETGTATESGSGEQPPRPYLLYVTLINQPIAGMDIKDAIEASGDEF
jgi:hypothetical protein